MTTSYSAQQKQHTTSHLKPRLRSFIAAREEQAFLSSRVSWWHARRGFIFCAFAPRDALRMNWAEVIHTGWVYRDRPNLSMLDIYLAGTQDSFFPDIELKDCQSVAAPGGKGPSYADRKKRNMLVMSTKPSDWARKCSLMRSAPDRSGTIALSSTESAKRQKSEAKPKQPLSQHSSATPSTQKHRNPISLPTSTVNNSTSNPQYGGFLTPHLRAVESTFRSTLLWWAPGTLEYLFQVAAPQFRHSRNWPCIK